MSSTAVSSVVIVMTTLGGNADAAAFARTLIDERLAACVNVLPGVTSTYRWKGVVEQEPEQQLLIKTTAARLDALEARFRSLHPYEVPEFIVLKPSDVAAGYLAWVVDSVS